MIELTIYNMNVLEIFFHFFGEKIKGEAFHLVPHFSLKSRAAPEFK